MEKPLILLFTHGIRGDLDLMPRLYTFIKRLKADLPAESNPLLVDLGDSCDAAVWHCVVTEGRSLLFALDSMGYDAANVQGVLTSASQEKLVDQVVVALVDDANPQTVKGVRFYTALPPPPTPSPCNGEGVGGGSETRPYSLSVCLMPVDVAGFRDGVIYLPAVIKGQIGIATLQEEMLTYAVHTMPAGTVPDATISGTVDFVITEARYYEKQHHERYNRKNDL